MLGRLVKGFGSASAALESSVSDLEERGGLSRALASRIKSELDTAAATRTLERISQLGWGVTLDSSLDYPGPLLEIAGRPPVLFYLGDLRDGDVDAIGVVGARRATEEGRSFAARLAGDLARSAITVVSGMARGIDRAAHQGALDAGGRTLAVLGCSLDYQFQPADRRLLERIAAAGAVISEFLPGAPTLPEHFPRRNRIISGLSQGVVVVEAGEKSGALLTAQNALDQNRELFAVPGFPGRRASVGTNTLIKNGAAALTEAADIFERLPRLKRQVTARRVITLSDYTPVERQIIESVTDGPVQLDRLSAQVGLPVTDVMPTLLALELKGVVRELSGKRFSLAE